MVDERNSRPKSSFLGRLKELGPLAVILTVALTIVSGIWFGFIWYGDVRYREGRSDMQTPVNDMALERNKAQISEESAKSSLNLLQMQNTTLEKENREYRDYNRDLRDSVSSLSAEIKQYKTRIIEIAENGAGEAFDNQFLIKLGDIRSDSIGGVIHYRAETFFAYIGDKPELLNKISDDRDGSLYTEPGDALSIKHGKMWYTLRLLYYDFDKKTATFSQNIFSKESTVM